MALWSAFYSDVAPMVAGCPEPTIDWALLRSAQKLFSGAPIWKAALTSVTVTAGNYTVAIASSAGGVWRVDSARIGGQSIDPIDEAQAFDRFGGDWETKEGTPSAMVMMTNGSGRLVPIPEADVTVAMFGCLQPAEAATGIPDDLFLICRHAISAGALGFLYGIPGQAWSDEGKAMKYEMIADQEKSRLALRAAKRFSTERIASAPKWC